MKKMNKFLAIILAASMAVSAAPLAFADEVTDEITNDPAEALINAEDESFEAAAMELIVDDEEEAYDEEYGSSNISLMATRPSAFVYNSTYDEVVIDDKCNDGTGTGAPDGSNYKIASANEEILKGISTSRNYYISFDFKLKQVPLNDKQNPTINQIVMRNKAGNVGPQFSLKGTDANQLTNQTGGSSYPVLYSSYDTNKWYKMELEGRMSVVGAYTSFTLYEYNGSTPVEVAYSSDLDLRNMSRSSRKGYEYTTLAEGVCYDNLYAVQEWPDEVVITEKESRTEVNAGATEDDALTFTASAARTGVDASNLTQPKFTWSLSGVKTGEENLIKIEDGRLTVDSHASAQNIKVIATAASNGNPKKEYDVAVKALDTSALKCDTITVSGSETINAGEDETFAITATKTGSDVTNDITDDEIEWAIMDSTGARRLGNNYITVNNGTVTVDSSVIGQDITVRAYLKANKAVYGETKTTIKTTASETIVNFNACEDKIENDLALVNQGSWDGSSYYTTNKDGDYLGGGTLADAKVKYTAGDIVVIADLKFTADGAGITTVRRDGGTGLFIQRSGGELAYDPDGKNPVKLGYALDTASWYHLELMFNQKQSSINIWKYDEDGNKTNKGTFTEGIQFRNSNPFTRITVNGNTGIDNYLVVYPNPTALEILDKDGNTFTAAVRESGVDVGAGIPYSFGIKAYRDGLPMPAFTIGRVGWKVYDSDNQYEVAGNDFSAAAGILSSNGLVKPQTIYLKAVSNDNNTVKTEMKVNIVASNQFEITGLGYDGGDAKEKTLVEDENHLVRLYVKKLGEYRDDVVFIMTLFDGDGKLAGSYSKKASGKSLKTGDNEVAIDYTLPEGFDKTSWTAKIMAWTSLTTNEEPEGASEGFGASYAGGTVTFTGLPEIVGKCTVAIYNEGTKDGDLAGDTSSKIAYVSQFDSKVTQVTTELAAGTYIAAVGGRKADGEYFVCKKEFTVN